MRSSDSKISIGNSREHVQDANTTHVFEHDAECHFKARLAKFHDTFDTRLLMCGVGATNSSLETVKMARMRHDMNYCARVIGGLQHFKPKTHVVLNDSDAGKLFECLYTWFVDDIHQQLTGLFFIQNAYKYPTDDQCLYQVWRTATDVTPERINKFWRG